jgi:hypothetical protein
MQMRYMLILLLLFMLAGCESSAAPATLDSAQSLSDVKKDEIKELARGGNEPYVIHKISEVDGLIEVQLLLTFNPLSFNEVMPLTGPFAEAVAALFDYNVPVGVAAVFTIAGSDTEMIFGESIFVPETGKVEYRHFGRDHILGYGDP